MASKTRNAMDWFLGGRALPFWIVGLSMFATSVDGGEYVSINGQSYKDGLSIIAGLMLGAKVGSIVAAFVVVPGMYRAGHFTNAEFLEVRFGTTSRILSVLVQIQYRTSVLATIMVSLQIVLRELAGLSPGTSWVVVTALAVITALYAAWGGLKTVAKTDVALTAIMITGITVLWITAWVETGGLEGFRQILANDIKLGGAPVRAGDQVPDASHPVVVLLGWISVVTGYFVVNHTQTMKLFGVRSMWDLKMAALLGGGLITASFFFSGGLGILGRNLFPDLTKPDMIYPKMVNELLAPGLKGLVVAGLLAASISTFTGIGAALSALFTRDLYARCLVRKASESHYLQVGRIATIVVVVGSFIYVPFILQSKTIVDFFIGITSVFVTPLMTVYLVGILTRVHKNSGLVGLLAGASYGLLRMYESGIEQSFLPFWFTEKFAAFLWSSAITTLAMLLTSIISGWEPSKSEELDRNDLKYSKDELPEVRDYPNTNESWKKLPWFFRPETLAFVMVGCTLIFVAFAFW